MHIQGDLYFPECPQDLFLPIIVFVVVVPLSDRHKRIETDKKGYNYFCLFNNAKFVRSKMYTKDARITIPGFWSCPSVQLQTEHKVSEEESVSCSRGNESQCLLRQIQQMQQAVASGYRQLIGFLYVFSHEDWKSFIFRKAVFSWETGRWTYYWKSEILQSACQKHNTVRRFQNHMNSANKILCFHIFRIGLSVVGREETEV